MTTRWLAIYVEMEDESDADWVRARVVPAADEAVAECVQSGRLDGMVHVSWTYLDEGPEL